MIYIDLYVLFCILSTGQTKLEPDLYCRILCYPFGVDEYRCPPKVLHYGPASYSHEATGFDSKTKQLFWRRFILLVSPCQSSCILHFVYFLISIIHDQIFLIMIWLHNVSSKRPPSPKNIHFVTHMGGQCSGHAGAPNDRKLEESRFLQSQVERSLWYLFIYAP